MLTILVMKIIITKFHGMGRVHVIPVIRFFLHYPDTFPRHVQPRPVLVT